MVIFKELKRIEKRILEIDRVLKDPHRKKEVMKGVAKPIAESLLSNANQPLLDELDTLKQLRVFEHDDRNLAINVFTIFMSLIVAGSGIIFSLFQLRTSNVAIQQSQESLAILANKEGVHLEPGLVVDGIMYKNSQMKAPRLFITNVGRVPAVNVVLQIIRRQFDGEKFVGAVWGSGEGASYIFDKVLTYETKELALPEGHIVNPEYNVIEIRVHYMREYDKKSYSYRTFYFYGPGDREFKSWYNIKQAQLLKEQLFKKVIEESMKLPKELSESEIGNFAGTSLYKF